MHQLCGQSVRQLFVADDEKKLEIVEETQGAPVIELSLVDMQWLQTLAEGWASPLGGFMRERQYLQCLHHGQLLDLKKKCTMPDDDDETSSSNDDVYPLLDGAINQSVCSPII